MKTTFHRKLNTTSSSIERFVYTFGTLIVAILIFLIFRSSIMTFFSFVWTADNTISRGLRSFAGTLQDKNSLTKENEILRERLTSFSNLETNFRALEALHGDLLAEFGRSTSTKFIAAGVLVSPPQTPYDVLIIDVGSEDGAKVGDKVSLPEGGVLGTVVETLAKTSRVALYSGSGTKTQAFLERGDIRLEIVGKGGGSFEAFLPRDVQAEVGDRIVLPGIDSELVAYVEEIKLEATDSSKSLLLRGVANISSTRFVKVY